MDDIFKNNAYRILEHFINYPTQDFTIRGIARYLKLSHATVLKYIGILEEIGFIRKKSGALNPTYFANTQNQKYKFYKKNYLVSKLMDTGLVDYIQKKSFPSSIILFGSGAKGTFTENSDIDIFVEATESELNITKYENKLNRKINLLFEPGLDNLSQELKNNIINGVVLYGFIKV